MRGPPGHKKSYHLHSKVTLNISLPRRLNYSVTVCTLFQKLTSKKISLHLSILTIYLIGEHFHIVKTGVADGAGDENDDRDQVLAALVCVLATLACVPNRLQCCVCMWVCVCVGMYHHPRLSRTT